MGAGDPVVHDTGACRDPVRRSCVPPLLDAGVNNLDRLLWWGEHGRGTWLMEGEHASFIIRCARADMIGSCPWIALGVF